MKKIVFLLTGVLCCGTATSQSVLTLEECKQLAHENNITLYTARNNISQAEQQKQQALTNFFPQVSAIGGGMTANKHLMQMELNLPAEMAASLAAADAQSSSIGMIKHGVIGNVIAMQPVFAGGQIVNGNKLARVGVEASRIQLEVAEDEVELTTEQYYWQVVSLQEKCVTLETVRQMLLQLEKDVTASVDAGVTTRNDLLQVQLKHNEVESQLLQVENTLSVCRQLLAQYIGKNGQDIQVDANIPYTGSIPIPERYDHMAVLSGTPQYRLMEKNVESQRLQHRLKIGEQLPTVSAGAVYTYNNLMGEGRGVGLLMATVSIPISGWWGGGHAIKKQKLALDQARVELQDNSQKLIINMNNCWANVETSQRQLAIAYKSIEQSNENLRLNNNYYRAGTTTMSDLLDAQSSYQQSRDNYVDAYIDYQESILKYRQAVGIR
ncbi:MAG: TolC family protein [Bacteroidaceae bacterium]|nr:TolC family protein [Bacteroidaceae bacterium]